jgi:hypothetical protein
VVDLIWGEFEVGWQVMQVLSFSFTGYIVETDRDHLKAGRPFPA